jgi:hypothetical protein
LILQEVLVSLTNISTGTIQTLINLSKGQNQDAANTRALEKEIIRLKGSIEAASGLVTFYDQRLREERENGALKRHMEEAKILTDSIRAIQRVQSTNEMPQLSRRNTIHNLNTWPKGLRRDFIPVKPALGSQHLNDPKLLNMEDTELQRIAPTTLEETVSHPGTQSRNCSPGQLHQRHYAERVSSHVDHSVPKEIVCSQVCRNHAQCPSESPLMRSVSAPRRRGCLSPARMPSSGGSPYGRLLGNSTRSARLSGKEMSHSP